ncbi:MAG: S8 family serine peptidase, partial [Pseudomonadota bacterium]
MAIRQTVVALMGACLLLTGGCASAPSVTSFAPVTESIEDDALLIVINDPRGERRRRGVGPGYRVTEAYADDPILARATTALASDYGLSVLEQWPLRNLGVHCFVVSRPAPEVVDAISADQRVKWLQPFNQFDLQSAAAAPGVQSADPDCLLCRFARDVDSLGQGVRIAVIDTAVDTTHPDLRDSRVDVRNFAGRRGNPAEEKHGTAVVGLIAARANGPKGLNGAAPDARVHLLRGCWQDGSGEGRCNTLTLALALDAAIDLEPDILNLSLTG